MVDEVIVVVRAGDEELHALLKSEASAVVVSQQAWRGMGHSLADAVFASSATVGWVVALGDMPRISTIAIRAVTQALQVHAKIILPVHNGERGHPVAFPVALRERLQGLTGDAGARDIIRMNPDLVVRLDLSDPGILRDVDTPADLTAIDQDRP